MSLEQLCFPSAQKKKPWLVFNGLAVNTNYLLVGPDAPGGLDARSVLKVDPGFLVYPNKLPVAKVRVDEAKADEASSANSEDDNKKIVASAYPQYLIQDTGGGFLEFVDYIPVPPTPLPTVVYACTSTGSGALTTPASFSLLPLISFLSRPPTFINCSLVNDNQINFSGIGTYSLSCGVNIISPTITDSAGFNFFLDGVTQFGSLDYGNASNIVSTGQQNVTVWFNIVDEAQHSVYIQYATNPTPSSSYQYCNFNLVLQKIN